jgi:hypothetical protein
MDKSYLGPYPPVLGPFVARGIQGCMYVGMKDQPGQLVCQGRVIQCEKLNDKMISCRENVIVTSKVQCSW